MIFETNQDFYQLLEIHPTASVQEIKSAYLKIKSAYRKDNLALYGMMDSSDCDDILDRIEEAYLTLSNADLRREYDIEKNFQSPMRMDELNLETPHLDENEIISIDRTPPMEMADNDDMLNPPTTDFGGEPSENPTSQNNEFKKEHPLFEESLQKLSPAPVLAPPRSIHSYAQQTLPDDWSGTSLRKMRESKRLSLDEVSHLTRISKTYLQAIEDESYHKLPAPVFVRGFLIQYAKILKLQPDAVASNYMSRFKKTS